MDAIFHDGFALNNTEHNHLSITVPGHLQPSEFQKIVSQVEINCMKSCKKEVVWLKAVHWIFLCVSRFETRKRDVTVNTVHTLNTEG